MAPTPNPMPNFAEVIPQEAHQYIPDEALQKAVEVAILLGKPLLLAGEPGSGKTDAAYWVAHHYGQQKPIRFNTRTTSTANDLFYHYDAVRHFQAKHNQANTAQSKAEELAEIEERYITYQGLGLAIKRAQEEQVRPVVLLDEIDKAPRDLPNDVLNILEDMAFVVPELGGKEWVADAAKRPVVIMTTNAEKKLPDAFLRRCLFHYMDFPTAERLLTILVSKVSSTRYTEAVLNAHVLPHFTRLRKRGPWGKLPATSELLYWVALLDHWGFDPQKLDEGAVLSTQEQHQLHQSYGLLAKSQQDLNMLTGKR